jgi:hypothetical protein
MFLGILVLFALFSLVVMLLWNAVMPGLLGADSLDYPRAAGLLLLCRILFGGLGAAFRGRGLGEHFRAMSPEQREVFSRRMHERFFGHEGHKDFGRGGDGGESRRARERHEGDSVESSRHGE